LLTQSCVPCICLLSQIHNVEVLIREDITVDQFIDVIEGNRVYLRCLYVINKIDCIHLDEVDRLAHSPNTVVVSCKDSLNLDLLLDKIWEYLDFIRIYTKVRGKRPDFSEPLIMRNGASMEHICHAIHREMVKNFKYALVWGTSAKQSVLAVTAGDSAAIALGMDQTADLPLFVSSPVSSQPQRVGISHGCSDEDVVSLYTKTV
jgi:ribosome-interacting GTPase 1